MSQRGNSIFVCLLLAAAYGWFEARRGNEAQAATRQGEAPARYRSGLRNAPGKQRLNANQLNQVLLSLREKTGWQSLAFDEEGFLVCPDPQDFRGGSEAARRLLSAALSGNKAYELEAHNASPTLAFARLFEGTTYVSGRTGTRISSRLVQIDFADFHQLRGEGPAIKAFDLGVAILHELAHGVWQLRDAAFGDQEPGECENFINQIRRELRLPERQHYFAPMRLSASNRTRLIAELLFTHTLQDQGQARQAKQKRFRLRWEAEAVGAITYLSLSQARQLAETGKLIYAP